MDHAVSSAYDWRDRDLQYGFRETAQGMRFTVSESSRCDVLNRLLVLNHRRHAEETAEEMVLGKQPKATAKRRRKAKAEDAHGGATLFSEVGD
jgi:hypothetical protein